MAGEENKSPNLSAYSPAALAFLGDAVFSLLVRDAIVRKANQPARQLHPQAADKVCATAQAAAAGRLMPILTEEELEVYRRGRNAHTNNTPKSASPGQYHSATGLETLFGWLYLAGREDRISELFSHIESD